MCIYELPVPVVYITDVGNGCCKVGKTKQPLVRMRTFNCSAPTFVTPHYIVPGDKNTEHTVKKYFDAVRFGKKREVFRLTMGQVYKSWDHLPELILSKNSEFYEKNELHPSLILVTEWAYKTAFELWDTEHSEEFTRVFDALYRRVNKWRGGVNSVE